MLVMRLYILRGAVSFSIQLDIFFADLLADCLSGHVLPFVFLLLSYSVFLVQTG